MSADEARRAELVATVRRLDAHGLNRGSTGNASVRDAAGQGVWITPTGMGAEVEPDDLVWLSLDGAQVRGRWQPSSEWHFHLAAHRARPWPRWMPACWPTTASSRPAAAWRRPRRC
jgi:L-fuculose-phosphate aldolase